MKTKIIFISFILLQAFILSSCKKEKKVTKIGFSIHGLTHERWQKDSYYVEKLAKEVGVEVVIKLAENNVQTQFEQIEEMLNLGVEAMLVVPVNSNKMANIVNLCHSYNVPIIAYDRMANNCKLDYYVSFDNVKVGEIQAKYLTNLKPKGKYVLLWGSTTDQNAEFFKIGQEQIIRPLQEEGDIEIVYEGYVPDWSAKNAYEITKSILEKHNDIDVILATNDELAKGVIFALKEAELLDKVLVSGMDADLSACLSIVEKWQTMSVYKPIKFLAKEALKIAKIIAEKGTIENPLTTINNGETLVPATLLKEIIAIDAENLNETVIADSFHTKEQIYID